MTSLSLSDEFKNLFILSLCHVSLLVCQPVMLVFKVCQLYHLIILTQTYCLVLLLTLICFYCHGWISKLKFLEQTRMTCQLLCCDVSCYLLQFCIDSWGMIEGCFFNAQLKRQQYKDHSVTATISSRHTIVYHRKKLHRPEKDKCV